MASAGIDVKEVESTKGSGKDGVPAETQSVCGHVGRGQAGMGVIPQPLYAEARGKDRCHLVLEEVRSGLEEVRISSMVSLHQHSHNVLSS